MALDDFIEPEVGVAVAITAAIASPTVRKAIRKSAVYGLAGVLMAGDAVTAFARGVKNGVEQRAGKSSLAPAETLTVGDSAAHADAAEMPVLPAAASSTAAPEPAGSIPANNSKTPAKAQSRKESEAHG